MAFTATPSRSASMVIPLAARFIAGRRYVHHSATLFSAVKHTDFAKKTLPQNPSPAIRQYSSPPALKRPSSDEAFIRVLDSQISLLEGSENLEALEVPEGFPFHIEDIPFEDNVPQQALYYSTIYLRREYEGETINVEVNMYSLTVKEYENDNDEDIEKPGQSSLLGLTLIVRVSKKGDPSLEFHLGANIDDIIIHGFSIKDPDIPEDQQPEFDDLAENVQICLYEYLEIRGIKPSTTNFVYAYMKNKFKREHRSARNKCIRWYKNWLKNVKCYVDA